MKLSEIEEKLKSASTEEKYMLILNKVLQMVARGDSKETIFETVEELRK